MGFIFNNSIFFAQIKIKKLKLVDGGSNMFIFHMFLVLTVCHQTRWKSSSNFPMSIKCSEYSIFLLFFSFALFFQKFINSSVIQLNRFSWFCTRFAFIVHSIFFFTGFFSLVQFGLLKVTFYSMFAIWCWFYCFERKETTFLLFRKYTRNTQTKPLKLDNRTHQSVVAVAYYLQIINHWQSLFKFNV